MKKVVVIGSGSWGTTAANLIAENITKLNDFDPEIKMWVFEEEINGKKLSEIINSDHTNPKYLPGITLLPNIKGVTNLEYAVQDATHLVFVVPHQFVEKIADDIKGKLHKNVVGISLIKGIIERNNQLEFICEMLEKKLNCHMSVLSGANISIEIAKKEFSETTIGSTNYNIGQEWKSIFETDYFKVNVINCCTPIELCGALKNCIALAAGFADGLEKGTNTKSALMRIGLIEMIELCKLFTTVEDYKIFFESFGVADLITTCFGGRNRLVAQTYIKTNKSFDELEKNILNGQKLQGPDTLYHMGHIIKNKNIEHKFPLLMSTYAVIFEKNKRSEFFSILKKFCARK